MYFSLQMGKASKGHKLKHRKYGLSACKRALRRSLHFTTEASRAFLVTSADVKEAKKRMEDAECLMREINDHKTQLQSLRTTLMSYNVTEPDDERSHHFFKTIGFVPATNDLTRVDAFPNENVKKLFQKALKLHHSIAAKNNRIRALTQAARSCNRRNVESDKNDDALVEATQAKAEIETKDVENN